MVTPTTTSSFRGQIAKLKTCDTAYLDLKSYHTTSNLNEKFKLRFIYIEKFISLIH